MKTFNPENWIKLGVLSFGLALTFGCERATEKECDQAFDHYFDLKVKGIPEVIKKVESAEFERKRAAFIARCVDETKPAVLRCWLKAESLEILKQCQSDTQMLTER